MSRTGKLGWSDVTPKADWMNRRQLMVGTAAALMAAPQIGLAQTKSVFSTTEEPNSFEDITSYNNYRLE